jgi:hypothetical protein
MKNLDNQDGELIYEAEIQFTEMVEFGVRMEAISRGDVPIPPEGARFDHLFIGELKGPKIHGEISGIDHLYVRADGCFQLHLHGRIVTTEGESISLSSEGISIQSADGGNPQLRATVSLFTSHPGMAWLNKLQLWAVGELDLERDIARIRAYAV